MSAIIGAPGSLQRYIVFGCLAGLAAASIAAALAVAALPLTALGAGLAGWLGGRGRAAAARRG
jgi:hypothetical protein